MAERCANCDTELRGEYCHACGQRDVDIRVAIWRLLGDAASEAFEIDGRLFATIVPLFVRPGELVAEYVAGRRKRYTEPVRIFLFALAASFLCFQIAGSRSLSGVADRFSEQPFEIVDHKLPFELRDEAGKGGSFAIELDDRSEQWFADGIAKLDGRTQAQAASMLLDGFLDATPAVVIVLVPLLALIFELLYPKFLVIEHLLLSANLHAVGLLTLGVASLVGLSVVDLAALLFIGWHVVAGQRRLYQQRWWVLALKSCGVFAAYFVLFLFAFVTSLFMTLWSL